MSSSEQTQRGKLKIAKSFIFKVFLIRNFVSFYLLHEIIRILKKIVIYLKKAKIKLRLKENFAHSDWFISGSKVH